VVLVNAPARLGRRLALVSHSVEQVACAGAAGTKLQRDQTGCMRERGAEHSK
jgi:hypothetical protein